jgi:hypothetical protein
MKIRKEGDDGWLYTDWESDEKEHLTAFDIQHIQMLLKNVGYKVSKRGIRHQWHGWKNMLGKSGYRGRSYRLFTPSGWNQFCIQVTPLTDPDMPSYYV